MVTFEENFTAELVDGLITVTGGVNGTIGPPGEVIIPTSWPGAGALG